MLMVEELLKASGDFGPAQWLMLSLFCMVNVLSSFHYFAQTFITLKPGTPCFEDGQNSTSEDYPYTFQTMTGELGWECDEDWKATWVQSLFFIGSVVGTLVMGAAADHFGRRPVLVLANIMAIFGNLLTAYLIPNVISMSIARFVAGLAVDSNFFMMYIIVMEYINPGMRTMGLNLCIGIWYCLGCMATPWVAISARDWRTFLTAISMPMLMVPLSAFFVPESAQWLLSRGRDQEALDCFKNVAKINRRKFSSGLIARFNTTSTEYVSDSGGKGGSIKGLFATPKLRKKTCILIFKTMVLTLCYDAMSRNIEGLGYDPFTMFTVTSATIFPSCLMILLLQDRVGRKAIAVLSLLLTGLLNLCQGTVLSLGSNYSYAAAMLSICSRFAVNIAYNSGTQYAAELIPTQVRGQGLSAIHVVGYFATFFSPHLGTLHESKTWIATPSIVLGILSMLGALFCMFLPETLGRQLPITLEDGESFGENDKFWDFKTQPKEKTEIRNTTNSSSNNIVIKL